MRIINLGSIKAILFDNKSIRQTIFKNSFWLGIGTLINSLFKLVLVIYVARILGATEYGKFTFALAFVSLFIVFANLGLSAIVTREFAREKARKEEFYSILSLKILLSLGTLILILIGSFFITPDLVIRKIIWILAISVLVDSFYSIIYGLFCARQRMEYEAWGEILNGIVVTGAGFFVILNFPSAENLSYAYLFAGVVSLFFILFLFHLKFLPFKIYWEKEVWKKFLSMSWPLALASLFSTLYINIDSAMMGHFNQITQTGWYNAAYRITNITLLPMALIAGSFFPVLSRFARPAENKNPDEVRTFKESLQKIWNFDLELMILLAVPLMVGGIILAPKIIELIYGQDFLPSILAFQILMIMTGILFLCRPFGEVLIASNQQRKIFWIGFWGAMVNIILNLILIPKFSLYGAAGATVATHLLMFCLLFRFTVKHTLVEPLKLKFLFYIIVAFFSSTVMYLVISRPQIYNLNIFLSILIGAATYGIFLFVLGAGGRYLRFKFLAFLK